MIKKYQHNSQYLLHTTRFIIHATHRCLDLNKLCYKTRDFSAKENICLLHFKLLLNTANTEIHLLGENFTVQAG